MYKLSAFFLFMSLVQVQLSFADCDEFYSSKLEEMNLGKLNQPRCGAMKNETAEKTRVSMSKVKGRKDRGPTLSMYKSDPSNVKIVQLFSKDKLTKHRHRYQYILGPNCKEIKSVTYLLGTLQTEVTKEKCDDLEDSFVDLEKVNLGVGKICQTYFPEQEKEIILEEKKTSSSAIRE